MRKKTAKKELVWNVLHHDSNSGGVVSYNVLAHGSFLDDVKTARRKIKEDDKFLEEVRRLMRYYFWLKCEYEVLVGGLFPGKGDKSIKIDAFDQVGMNWEAFSAYLVSALPRKGRNSGGSVKKPLSVELVKRLLAERFPREAERALAGYDLGIAISSKLEAFFVEYAILKKDGSRVATVAFDFEDFHGFYDEDDLYRFWFERFKRAWSLDAKAREAAGTGQDSKDAKGGAK